MTTREFASRHEARLKRHPTLGTRAYFTLLAMDPGTSIANIVKYLKRGGYPKWRNCGRKTAAYIVQVYDEVQRLRIDKNVLHHNYIGKNVRKHFST